MELITPSFGLIFWQTLTFVVVLLLLRKFAWKPIMSALTEREQSIEDALAAAEKAKIEMASLKAENEKLLDEARLERDRIIKDAVTAANNIKEEARAEAGQISKKMLDDAKAVIEVEKKAAITEMKNQVAILSLEIAEKLLRNELQSENAQKMLVQDYINNSLKVN